MDVIYSYTRKQAIEDGVLVDVTELARDAGIKYPTALTQGVWNKYVEVPEAVPWQEMGLLFDETGRLWDILWMFRCRAKSQTEHEFCFKLYVQIDNSPAELVTLKAHCGPGDDAEPVITIMLPNED